MMVQPLAEPPRFLADVNFNRRIISGLRRQAITLDCVTAQELGWGEIADPMLLRQAREIDRILLTHDINTIPGFFAALLSDLQASEHSPGVMIVAQGTPIGVAIQSILEVWGCSLHTEWRNQVVFLPL